MLRRRAMVLPTVLTAALVAGVPSGVRAAGNDDAAALKEQVTRLQNRVVELEKQLAHKRCRMNPLFREEEFDLFGQIDAIDQQMQSMLAQPFFRHTSVFSPGYDVKATDKAYVISFDMPGMDKAKINVEVKDGILQVSGERSSETKEDQGGKVYRQERSFGYFSRAIPLPDDAKPESVKAKYENGVLVLTVDRKEAAVPQAPARQKIEVK